MALARFYAIEWIFKYLIIFCLSIASVSNAFNRFYVASNWEHTRIHRITVQNTHTHAHMIDVHSKWITELMETNVCVGIFPLSFFICFYPHSFHTYIYWIVIIQFQDNESLWSTEFQSINSDHTLIFFGVYVKLYWCVWPTKHLREKVKPNDVIFDFRT